MGRLHRRVFTYWCIIPVYLVTMCLLFTRFAPELAVDKTDLIRKSVAMFENSHIPASMSSLHHKINATFYKFDDNNFKSINYTSLFSKNDQKYDRNNNYDRNNSSVDGGVSVSYSNHGGVLQILVNLTVDPRFRKYDVATGDLLNPGYLTAVNGALTSNSWKSIPFLKNYKNPCWKEEITLASIRILYQNNSIIEQETKGESARMYGILRSYLKYDIQPRLQNASTSWQLRCLPHFYIIGQAKCGTTDLWTKLKMHPQIKPGLKKEYHWWARYRTGVPHDGKFKKVPLIDYVEMFDIAAKEIDHCRDKPNGSMHPCITADISISTMSERPFFAPDINNTFSIPAPEELVPGFLHRLQPQARLIVMLRNPVERLYSAYNYFTKFMFGRTPSAAEFHNRVVRALPVFHECARLYGVRACAYSPQLKCQMEVDIGEGLYSVFLKDWLMIYPREQILILTLEDYSKSRTDVINKTLRHIGLDPLEKGYTSQQSTKNKGQYKNMLMETATLLMTFYKPFNDQLVQLLGDASYARQWDDESLKARLLATPKPTTKKSNLPIKNKLKRTKVPIAADKNQISVQERREDLVQKES